MYACLVLIAYCQCTQLPRSHCQALYCALSGGKIYIWGRMTASGFCIPKVYLTQQFTVYISSSLKAHLPCSRKRCDKGTWWQELCVPTRWTHSLELQKYNLTGRAPSWVHGQLHTPLLTQSIIFGRL